MDVSSGGAMSPVAQSALTALNQHFVQYDFDDTVEPYISSYDEFHFVGKERAPDVRTTHSLTGAKAPSNSKQDGTAWVLARVSMHGERLLREWELRQRLIRNDDECCLPFLRQLHCSHLQVRGSENIEGEEWVALVSEAPVKGPNWERLQWLSAHDLNETITCGVMPLPLFMDFAIGAAKSCESLHQRSSALHGSITGDAFHFDKESRNVWLSNIGLGAYRFERGLVPEAWVDMSMQKYFAYSLQFVAPEQTGRLASKPDYRSDVYALGCLFWIMLTGKPQPFQGATALDILHSVMTYRLPLVVQARRDCPDAVAQLVEKMTSKISNERYNTMAAVKHDLIKIRKLMLETDKASLNGFQIGATDISCFFTLPTKLIAREAQMQLISDAISDRDIVEDQASKYGVNAERKDESEASQNMHEEGQTKIITIIGVAGSGKTSVLQHTAAEAHRLGYHFCSTKFQQIQQNILQGPAKLLALLLIQIFSEQDIGTPFHVQIRKLLSPVWPFLQQYLDLPRWLLESVSPNASRENRGQRLDSRNSSRTASTVSRSDDIRESNYWMMDPSRPEQKFARLCIQMTKQIAVQRRLCLAFDDLQFAADSDCVNLIQKLIEARIPAVFVLVSRSTETFDSLLRPDQYRLQIQLQRFTSTDISQYVTETIHRPEKYCQPFIVEVERVSKGNPMLTRDYLVWAHQYGIIYFSWQATQWEISFNKLLDASMSRMVKFSGDGELLHRLSTLSTDCQSLLCWASVLGDCFSANLLTDLLISEYANETKNVPARSLHASSALQDLIDALVILPADEDDLYQFSHDRYLTAACRLCDKYDKSEMHFSILLTIHERGTNSLLRYGPQTLTDEARHVFGAVTTIKHQVPSRHRYREILLLAADDAKKKGARHTALSYLECCLDLLQVNPWEDGEDSTYDETLEILNKIAQRYWWEEDTEKAMKCLDSILLHARKSEDKIPTYIARARMSAASSDPNAALGWLIQAFALAGIHFREWTWDECDTICEKITPGVLRMLETPLQETGISSTFTVVGSLFLELLGTCYYTDVLLYYRAVLEFFLNNIQHGYPAMIGLLWQNLALVRLARFGDAQTAVILGQATVQLTDEVVTEPFTAARIMTSYPFLVGHLYQTSNESHELLQKGKYEAIAADDKLLYLMNHGVSAAVSLLNPHTLPQVEASISSLGDRFPEWPRSIKGGTMMTAVLQYSRALQGKTAWQNPRTIFDDDQHNSQEYLEFLQAAGGFDGKYVLIYKSYHISALVQLGYYKESLQLAQDLYHHVFELWADMFAYRCLMFIAFCFLGNIRRPELDTALRDKLTDQATVLLRRLEQATQCENSNYQFHLHMLRAEVADVTGNSSLPMYEKAIEIAGALGSVPYTAYALAAYGAALERLGALQLARTQINASLAMFRQHGAFAKIEHLSKRFSTVLNAAPSSALLIRSETLKAERKHRDGHETIDPNDFGDRGVSRVRPLHTAFGKLRPVPERLQTRVRETEKSMRAAINELDVIDLSAILQSFYTLNLELEVEKLAVMLRKVVAETTGATSCGICFRSHDADTQWQVIDETLSTSREAISELSIPLSQLSDPFSKQVATYVLRSKETIFLQSVLDDDRFAHLCIDAKYKMLNTTSLVAMPIMCKNELLGCVYCQAPSGTFTTQTTSFLTLLVMQMASSFYNAVIFERIVHVSQAQKRALEQAHRAEAAAKTAEAKAQALLVIKDEAVKAKSMFLANVSHELRTPLNGVIGMSEMLLRGEKPLNNEQQEQINSIKVCGDYLLSIINDILDFSKLEAGKMEVKAQPFNLSETIQSVVKTLSPPSKAKGIRTITQLQPDLPSSLIGDSVRLQQVLMNLLSNAYKFTPHGTVTIAASVNPQFQHSKSIGVTISVSDTGIGIAKDQQKKLFLPFSQGDSSTERKYGGTGLGLSICRSIVEQVLGGSIQLVSDEGAGTTVTFTAIFQKTDPPTYERNESTHPAKRPPSRNMEAEKKSHSQQKDQSSISICIAEDNPINQKVVMSFLKKLGFAYKVCDDGEKAIHALEDAIQPGHQPLDLVLMDIQMPVLDGYAATKMIRKHVDARIRNVPIVALTASAVEGDREECLAIGMNDYLAKPVKFEQLRRMLDTYLNKDM